MSDYPSYPPPPPGPPGVPPGGLYPRPPRRTANWLGYILGAVVGAPVVAVVVGGGLSSLGSAIGGAAQSIAGLLAMVLCIGIPIALIVPERTRPWGIGILIGYALWAIVAAGACVVLLAVLVQGEASS